MTHSLVKVKEEEEEDIWAGLSLGAHSETKCVCESMETWMNQVYLGHRDNPCGLCTSWDRVGEERVKKNRGTRSWEALNTELNHSTLTALRVTWRALKMPMPRPHPRSLPREARRELQYILEQVVPCTPKLRTHAVHEPGPAQQIYIEHVLQWVVPILKCAFHVNLLFKIRIIKNLFMPQRSRAGRWNGACSAQRSVGCGQMKPALCSPPAGGKLSSVKSLPWAEGTSFTGPDHGVLEDISLQSVCPVRFASLLLPLY
jgi:hypothetical protein